jgi:hypothetical protein
MKAARTKDAPDLRWEAEIARVAALAAFASVISFLIYFRNGDILLYGDAVAHINIARRVFDSRTPGLLQLGTVWLPLPHLLMIPFLISKSAWQTGVGGSFPSMVAYVFSVAGIFRLVRGALAASGRTQQTASVTAWFAAGIYGLNPNLLYLQSTAMTETLYLALFIWAVVYFSEFQRAASRQEWSSAAKRSLWKCGGCLVAACLARYDGWFLAACIAGAVIVTGWRSGAQGTWRTVSTFVLLAAAGPLLWFAYNGIVYRNGLEFANGPYSARAIEQRNAVAGNSPHPGTHNLPVAGLYFLKAAEFSVAEGTLQRLWLFLAAVGLLPVMLDRRLGALLLLWAPLPFYMLSVSYAGVPIYTPAWWPHSLYNLRYGVQLLPALTVFLALAVQFMVSMAPSRYGKSVFALLGAGVVIVSYVSVWKAQPACYREASVNSRTRLQLERALAEQLKGLPPRASLLMYLGEHVGALQDAGIPLDQTINEGNHRVWKQPSDPEGLWEHSLADPARYADFAIAFEGDPVWHAVHELGLPSLVIIAVNGQHKAGIYRTH